MNSEDKYWAVFAVSVISGFVVVILAIVLSYYAVRVSAFSHGYEETTLPGQSGTAWVKAK